MQRDTHHHEDFHRLPNNVIVFDGICRFCNASINFVIRNDPNTVFYFARAQSNTGSAILRSMGLDPQNPLSVVLIKNGEALTKSNAALTIATHLKRPWSFLRILRAIPVSLRDWLYSLVANNRYRIFGKHQHCMLPSAQLRSRFLD